MKIVITLPAIESLREIHDYYKENASARVADKIKSGIAKKLRFLAQHPLTGQEEETLRELNLGHRRMVEGNYKIIYRIIDNVIYVTDIFDSRRDPSKVNS